MEAPELQSERPKLMIESPSLEDLNEDLLAEILLRLSYKQVALCKCVCKKWFSLIFNPHFVSRFSSINIQPWTFIYQISKYKFWQGKDSIEVTSSDSVFKSSGFSFEFLPLLHSYSHPKELSILKTNKDLVLCSLTDNVIRSSAYYVCNPLTMQWVLLPPSPDPRWSGYFCFDFVCESTKDPMKKRHPYTFKVVQVSRRFHATESMVEIKALIFSSEINQWNEISHSVSDPDDYYMFRLGLDELIIWNEKLILLGSIEGMPSSKAAPLRSSTMAVNIIIDNIFNGGQVTKKIIYDSMFDFGFGKIQKDPQGSGLLLARTEFVYKYQIQIWELREEYDYEWTLVHEVCLDAVSKHEWVLNYSHFDRSILGFDPYDVNVLYLNLENCRIGKYDIQKRSLNIVSQLASPCEEGAHPFILQLWPTPVLPSPQLALC